MSPSLELDLSLLVVAEIGGGLSIGTTIDFGKTDEPPRISPVPSPECVGGLVNGQLGHLFNERAWQCCFSAKTSYADEKEQPDMRRKGDDRCDAKSLRCKQSCDRQYRSLRRNNRPTDWVPDGPGRGKAK